MLDIDIIDAEIKRFEDSDRTTMTICEKLATLYTVRDHLKKNEKVSQPITQTSSTPSMIV
jgi:hypothetical protein